MSREIKFRFWDGTSGNMCMAYTAEDGYITYSSGWKLSMMQAIKEGNAIEGYDAPKALMQFTGLHDKNGVEIYEGDIDTHGRFMSYEDGCFWWKRSNGWRTQLYDRPDRSEVVGNIHENPDLLA